MASIVFLIIAVILTIIVCWRIETNFCIDILCWLQTAEEGLKGLRFLSREN